MELNEKVQTILFVAFQFIVDEFIDSRTRVANIDLCSGRITLLLRDGQTYHVTPAFTQTETMLHSVDTELCRWQITLPQDVLPQFSGFTSLGVEERKKALSASPRRAILTMHLTNGGVQEVILPHTLNCQKLVAALGSDPQIITDEDYEEITPTLAAGWQLVTLPNPQRHGTRDTLLLLPQRHPIALESFAKRYGKNPPLTKKRQLTEELL